MLKNTAMAAMFVALYFCLDQFAMPFGGALRITISGLAIALAGIILGWKYGATVGLCGDLLMFFLKNHAQGDFMPELTLTAVLTGVAFGVFAKGNVKIALTQVLVTAVLTMFWDTTALSWHYSGGFWHWFWIRLPVKAATCGVLIVLEIALVEVYSRFLKGGSVAGTELRKKL